jgi:phage terminase small subunit
LAYLSIKDGRTESNAYTGRKLTPKMLSFVDAYFGAANFNALRAIELSEYNCKTKFSIHKTSAELMNHPLVKAEIDRRMVKREQKSEVKAEYLINKLIEIIDNLGETSEKTADRLRAIELAGKAIALWKERQEVTGADGGAIQHEQHVKESVADFTSRISSLVKRGGTGNVVNFPERGGTG